MREIKFRGKRIDNGEWSYGDLIQLLGDQGKGRKFIVDNRFGACIDSDGSFVNTEAPFVNEVVPKTVGEYTGLKDKNGKEIYEGDIVKGQRVRRGDIRRHIGQVQYRGAHFIVDGVKQYEHITDDLDCGYEVIGNIYENSELLQGGEPA